MKNKNSKKIITLVAFILVMVVISITVTNAYYSNTSSMRVLASLVGDFDMGDGDINMMFYKQNDYGAYDRVYSIPVIGYTFDDTKTNCTITCDNKGNNSATTASCFYSYDTENKEIRMDSDEKVTCKFYFNKNTIEDVSIKFLKEDANGAYEYNSKNYSLTDNIPSYGYDYVNYSCKNGSTIEYLADSRAVKVNSLKKDECYVYFDSNGNKGDIITNIYIKEETEYKKVEYIPLNKSYKLSETMTSKCLNDNNTDTGANITYSNGRINIESVEKQTCNIYLDLITE